MLYLHSILNSVWMIDTAYAANFVPLIASYIQGTRTAVSVDVPKLPLQFSTTVDQTTYISPEDTSILPDEAPEKSVAILSIRGAITKHNQSCGPVGMSRVADLLDQCYANEDIQGIVLRIESGGGEAYAMRMINEALTRKNKPVVGFVEDLSCSAAYGIISGCDRIVANSNLARIGSIGTYQTIVDHTESLKQRGINLIEIYASASTDKNADYHQAIKGNVEPLRKSIDVINEAFLSQIEKNRGDKLKTSREQWATGKVFFAKEALDQGLIDDIDTLSNVLKYF